MAVAAVGSSSTPELADLLDEAGRVLAGLVPASEEGDPVLMAEVLIELAGSGFLAEATRSGRRRVLSDGVERDSAATTTPGSFRSESSGTIPGSTHACLLHSMQTSCQATTVPTEPGLSSAVTLK
jgi:hypothetical protein